jgi:hypothetical protein
LVFVPPVDPAAVDPAAAFVAAGFVLAVFFLVARPGVFATISFRQIMENPDPSAWRLVLGASLVGVSLQ